MKIFYPSFFRGWALLVTTIFSTFPPQKKYAAAAAADSVSYIPGVYSACLVLGRQNVNVEVAVDADYIRAVSVTSLSDAVETMYPLMAPAAASLADQIVAAQSLENLSYPEGSLYTSQALVNAVKRALDKAAAD